MLHKKLTESIVLKRVEENPEDARKIVGELLVEPHGQAGETDPTGNRRLVSEPGPHIQLG